MPKQVLTPPGSPPPIAPFSPGTNAGNIMYTSGLLPLDKDGKLIGTGDIFKTDPPARYSIRCDLVRPEFLVEIACIAHVGK